MRTSENILLQFSIENIRKYQEYLNSGNEQQRIAASMEILNINAEKFRLFPFRKDKEVFLQYKTLITQFECHPSKFPGWEQNLDAIQSLIDQSQKIIQPQIEKHRESYSPFAQGLATLYQRTGEVDKSNDLEASVLQIGKKEGGIEPGFLATHTQDLAQYLLATYSEQEIQQRIDAVKGNIKLLQKELEKELAFYMYKMDYKSTGLLGIRGKTPVKLEREDVERTSAVNKAMEISPVLGEIVAEMFKIAKNSTSLEVNIDTVLETLSNDLASIFMSVQEQKLFKTQHENGDLKLMPSCKWVKGAAQLGSKKKPLIEGYRVKKLPLPIHGIEYISDNSILNLSRYYIPLLFTGDYDKVGSVGQNMLIVPKTIDEKTGKTFWELVGIDFGHTLREANRAGDLLADGRFTQPFFKPFANFSALSDGTLREKMEGVHILAKLYGAPVSQNIINSFDVDFQNKWQNITSDEGSLLCRSYINALQNLRKTEPENGVIYDRLIQEVEKFQNLMQTDLQKYLKVFENYLHLPADILDLTDNLNLFAAGCLRKTAMTKGKVILNHMKIDSDYDTLWTVKFYPESNSYEMIYPDNNKVIFNALKKYSCFQSVTTKNTMSFKFHATDLPEINKIFNEKTVQNAIHPKESNILEISKASAAFMDLVKAPWFTKHNVQMDYYSETTHIKLIIYPVKNSNGIDKKLLDLFSRQLNCHPDEQSRICVLVTPNDLPDLLQKLLSVPDKYEDLLQKEREEKLQAEQQARALAEKLQAEQQARALAERLQAEQQAKALAEKLQAEQQAKALAEKLQAEQQTKALAEKLQAEQQTRELTDTRQSMQGSFVSISAQTMFKPQIVAEENSVEELLKHYQECNEQKIEQNTDSLFASFWHMKDAVGDAVNYHLNAKASISVRTNIEEWCKTQCHSTLITCLKGRSSYIATWNVTDEHQKIHRAKEEGLLKKALVFLEDQIDPNMTLK